MRMSVILAGVLCCTAMMFQVRAQSVLLDDFSFGINGPEVKSSLRQPDKIDTENNTGDAFNVWYEIAPTTYSQVFDTKLNGSSAMRMVDGGWRNGIYCVYEDCIPADGSYRLLVDMKIEERDNPKTPRSGFDGIRRYRVGAVVNGKHRKPDEFLKPLDLDDPGQAIGHYSGLTKLDDSALEPQTVATGEFFARAGDSLLVMAGTDLITPKWEVGSAIWEGSFVVMDNIRLVPAGTMASVPDNSSIEEALNKAEAGKGRQALEELEGLIAASRTGRQESISITGVYRAIAVVKALLNEPGSARWAAFYEGIQAGADDPDIFGHIRQFALQLPTSERESVLWGIAKEFPEDLRGESAAVLLVQQRIRGKAESQVHAELEKLLIDGAGTPVVHAAAKALLQRGRHEPVLVCVSSLFSGAFASATQGVSARKAAAAYADWLLDSGKTAEAQQLCSMVRQRKPDDCSWTRRLEFWINLQRKDVLNALAAVSEFPLGSHRVQLLEELARIDSPSAMRSRLAQLIEAAPDRVSHLARWQQTLSGQPWELYAWAALGEQAESIGLPLLAGVAYQRVASLSERHAVSAETGLALEVDFARDAQPLELASFWKAQALAARGNPELAGVLLEGCTTTASQQLRSQAFFDLARVRMDQKRASEAAQLIASCSQLLPMSSNVANSKAAIDEQARSQAEWVALAETLERKLQEARDASDPQVAAKALLEAADLELKMKSVHRATTILDALLTRYPDSPVTPQAYQKQAAIYRDLLNDPERAESYLQKLAEASYVKPAATSKPGQ